MTNHQVDPHLFVVFGATSDLMRRKLLPALYRFSEQYGTQKLLLVGVSPSARPDRCELQGPDPGGPGRGRAASGRAG